MRSDDAHTLNPPALRSTIGFLLKKNRSGITVCMEDDRQADSDNDCQTVTTIPAKMIVKILELAVVGERASHS
jgi:hypothetical protein